MMPRERYRLDKQPLGRGGFGTVLRATHKETGETVALKRRKGDKESRVRLKREIDVLRSLKHEHIIRLLDSSPLDDWYTMPLAEGTLAQLREQLGDGELLRAIQQAATGLAFAHERGFIHRDVTPSNILALRDSQGVRRWVVADWGLVRKPRGQTSHRVTKEGLGTEGFLAPESWRAGHDVDLRADSYSLGRVVAWAVTGENLIPNIPRVPDGPWKAFVQHTTELEPGKRPKTMIQVLELLQELGAAPAPPQVLVWLEDAQERLVTSWLQLDGGSPQVLGQSGGLLVSEGEQLWSWRTSMRNVLFQVPAMPELSEPAGGTGIGRLLQRLRGRTPDRPEAPAPIQPQWREQGIEDAHLDDVLRGQSWQLSPLHPHGHAEPDYVELERKTQVISSLKQLLFITTWQRTFFQGAAHGNREFDFYVYDAASKTRVDALSAQELEPSFREERDLAFEQLRKLDLHSSYEEFTPDDVSLTLYRPFHDASGKLKLELQFTSATAYAASDNLWSSYTCSVRLTSTHIPAALQEFVSPPDALTAFLATTGTVRRMGWSTVGTSPAARAWLKEVFVPR